MTTDTQWSTAIQTTARQLVCCQIGNPIFPRDQTTYHECVLHSHWLKNYEGGKIDAYATSIYVYIPDRCSSRFKTKTLKSRGKYLEKRKEKPENVKRSRRESVIRTNLQDGWIFIDSDHQVLAHDFRKAEEDQQIENIHILDSILRKMITIKRYCILQKMEFLSPARIRPLVMNTPTTTWRRSMGPS